jgi:hypothetical protein
VSTAVSVSKKVLKLEKQQETLAMELLRHKPGLAAKPAVLRALYYSSFGRVFTKRIRSLSRVVKTKSLQTRVLSRSHR